MILPQIGSLAIPTPSLQQTLSCQGRPRPASAQGQQGLALELVLSCLWQEAHCLLWHIPFLQPSVLSLLDSCSYIHLLPNKGPQLGDYRWWCRWA